MKMIIIIFITIKHFVFGKLIYKHYNLDPPKGKGVFSHGRCQFLAARMAPSPRPKRRRAKKGRPQRGPPLSCVLRSTRFGPKVFPTAFVHMGTDARMKPDGSLDVYLMPQDEDQQRPDLPAVVEPAVLVHLQQAGGLRLVDPTIHAAAHQRFPRPGVKLLPQPLADGHRKAQFFSGM